jgi:hypothetical protein
MVGECTGSDPPVQGEFMAIFWSDGHPGDGVTQKLAWM